MKFSAYAALAAAAISSLVASCFPYPMLSLIVPANSQVSCSTMPKQRAPGRG